MPTYITWDPNNSLCHLRPKTKSTPPSSKEGGFPWEKIGAIWALSRAGKTGPCARLLSQKRRWTLPCTAEHSLLPATNGMDQVTISIYSSVYIYIYRLQRMLEYINLVPGCPWTPGFCDGEVEVANVVPRAGEGDLGVEIPADNSSISASARTCMFVCLWWCPFLVVDYLNSHTRRRWSISHFNVGSMLSGESLKSAKTLHEHHTYVHDEAASSSQLKSKNS